MSDDMDLDFMDFEMRSYACTECWARLGGPDDVCCKPKLNVFIEGATAYIDWFEAGCVTPIPDCPYEEDGTKNAENWQTGFDDAMNYQLYGQYEEFEDNDE